MFFSFHASGLSATEFYLQKHVIVTKSRQEDLSKYSRTVKIIVSDSGVLI